MTIKETLRSSKNPANRALGDVIVECQRIVHIGNMNHSDAQGRLLAQAVTSLHNAMVDLRKHLPDVPSKDAR